VEAKQQVDIRLAQMKLQAIEAYCSEPTHAAAIDRLNLRTRLDAAKKELNRCKSGQYLADLQGTLGVDPALVST
jgi:hypothetical protein